MPTWSPPTAFRPSIAYCPEPSRSARPCACTAHTTPPSCSNATASPAPACSASNSSPSINIDHHVSGRAFGRINWIDHGAASVGELVYRLVKAAGGVVTPEMAVCLYTTLLTDTGGFCYGATCASTFALAHELALAGADPIRIAQDVYFSTPFQDAAARRGPPQPQPRRPVGLALDRARRYGPLLAAEEDCEGIVNYALSVAGVEAAIFLRELPERRIRVSLRGKGHVNVAELAGRLGGGGHESAAGCTLDGPLDRALDEILTLLRPALAKSARSVP